MSTTAEFFCGLKKVKVWSEKSFTELAEHSKRLGYPLARSTLHSLCSDPGNRRLPASFRQIENFLRTCGVPPEQITPWEEAYRRLMVGDTPGVTMPVGEVVDFGSFREDDFEPPVESPVKRLSRAALAIAMIAVGLAIGVPAGALLF